MHRKIKGLLTNVLLAIPFMVSAQTSGATTEIRYVSKSGTYANDGKTWATAKANIQDAINDLVDNGLKGEVWVAAGTYTPTESTESSGGSTLYMSFKIPAGISVCGGFRGEEKDDAGTVTYAGESSKDDREKINPKAVGYFYKYQTILSGDLSSPANFEWSATKEQWNTSFYGNCYHVVTFATEGFDATTGRAKSNGGGYRSALLEGCIVEHGNATNNEISGRPHNAYGGGVYMVEGSYLMNCWVRECVASRDGGGIYMDGGGYVEHCAVSECQALGIGTSYGYGGGVCMEGPDKQGVYPMIQRQGIINSCVGRMGGGLAVKVNDLETNKGKAGDSRYQIACTAVLVANNTATTEGGGVYMNRGGALTQMTVVNNKCNGAGVTVNGMTTGRAAGVYCRDNAVLANSVLWGGVCSANNDIQYASSRSGNDQELRPYVMYTSLTKNDHTDWSGVIKNSVTKLSDYNTTADAEAASAVVSASEGYPMFYNPTPNAGYVHSQQQRQFLISLDGTPYAATAVDKDGNAVTDLQAYDFQPTSRSTLNHKGLNVVDIDKIGQTPAYEVDWDITGKQYNPRPTLGAYTTPGNTIKPEVIDDGTKKEVNFYVHPNAVSGTEYPNIGSSWDQPIHFFADALSFISDDQEKTSPEYCKDGYTVNVYVKEGTVDNTSAEATGRVRSSGFNIPSNVNIYGGYPSTNTGTSLAGRQVNAHETTITGYVQGDYDTNVAHLLRLQNVENTVIDGLHLRYANSRSTELLTGTLYTEGAAVTMYKSKNVKMVNCAIAGNTASAGAALKLIGSTGIYFENCIVHNNESRELDANGNVTSYTGNIVVDATSEAVFNHCNFVRNVGIGIDSYGTTKVYNTIFYANMREPVEDTRGKGDKALVAVRCLGSGTYTGDHNLYDAMSATFVANNGLDATNETILTYEYSETSQTYPRFLNPTKNAGVNTSGDATYYGRTISYMPHNNNPVVNRAAAVDANGNAADHTQWGVDMVGVSRDYGGLPDIGAFENHEAIDTDGEGKIYADGQKAYGSVMYVRDYNTYTYDADGNATLETEDLSTVHDDGTQRDGSSWENAINGNAPYTFTYTYTTVTASDPKKLVTPSASSLDNPTVFKIGLLANNTPGNTIYYAKQNGTYLNPTTTIDNGDDFVLIADGTTGYYYIYDKTVGKYVTFTQDTQGADAVVFVDSKDASGTWRLLSINANDTYHTYCIQPSTTTAAESSQSWNYYGGAANNNNIGLYTGSDAYGKWQFFTYDATATATTTTSTEEKNINGLQYAVSTVESEMSKDYTLRFTTQEETSVAGTYSTFHLYQDLPADYATREVWVGAGIYTCTTGYEVCNHVKVYGAFPKTGTPGKNERQPQLTTGITLSKANQGLTVSDYETILQTNSSTTERDNCTHDVSVLSQPIECRVTTDHNTNIPANRVIYEGAEWDGFTIRYGSKSGIASYGSGGGRDGGAGLRLYENVTITNCIIRDNMLDGGIKGRGGGAYVDGSTIVNCYIMNNYGSTANQTGNEKEMYGGGMYMIKGTIYNSVITGNTVSGSGSLFGAGAFFESADFFNNTVVNNTGAGAVEVWTASAADAHLTLYNSIIMAGDKKLVDRSNSTTITFKYCFLQSTATANDARNNYNYLADDTNKWYCGTDYAAADFNPFAKEYDDAVADYDFRIEQKDLYNAVNAGTQDIEIGGVSITIPNSDMDYTDRVQDCEIDIGAYEYNGAYSISPDITTNDADNEAIFYVTPEGRGNASASSPDNAACASKLQRVLDAAGRYKYAHPNKRVIVKVATYADTSTKFQYYACRTTDATADDVRVWSIIVPRGVEVWGGYTDAFTSSDDNGFYTKTTDSSSGTEVTTYPDNRDVTGNPTYFDSYYYNSSEKSDVYTYHVVSFTDNVFDSDGNAYAADDYDATAGTFSSKSSYAAGTSTYLSLKLQTTDRAVVDGIFITGGNADAKTASSDVNINQYGGAAIVTDYAHVRNCIVRGNAATYGGALALTHGALVSGCLIDQNTADYGGAIYVFENGTELSDGTVIASKAANGESMDKHMAHVYTSTIVNNLANQQGGGIYFGNDDDNINVRVNSSVVWQNSSSNMANVSGLYNPTKTDEAVSTKEFFPFSYCAVQNLRLSGVNNLTLANVNKSGARFRASAEDKADGDKTKLAVETNDDDFTRLADFGYYALTDYSILVRTGMPTTEYADLVANDGLAQNDFTDVDRLVSENNNRSYIEMGARALDKIVAAGQLMLRLFVAQPTDIDMDAAETMMNLTGKEVAGSMEEYYSQEGSSFAYPMQSLQDALDYIIKQRSLNEDSTALVTEGANNLPFEICMGRGTFYPTRTTYGIYGNSPANTFAVPEGVSIYGGFSVGNPNEENSFFGRYYKAVTGFDATTPGTIDGNVTTVVTAPADTVVTLMSKYKIEQRPTSTMVLRRPNNDNNGNNIIEPWEFKNQTILSGDAGVQTKSGLYHVLSVIADQNVVGMLPKQLNCHADPNETYHTMSYQQYIDKFGAASFDYEEGQYVTLDGLQITGGGAMDYVDGSTGFYDKYNFYCGGGLVVDGNRYCNDYNNWDGATYKDVNSSGTTFGTVVEKHGALIGSVAYRDIPVNIANCKFVGNEGGFGGAIYSNGTLNIYKSSFENNEARSGVETMNDASGNPREVHYPGNGGAIVCTHQLGAYNVIFANNEAYSDNTSLEPRLFQNIDNAGNNLMHSGSGGAVFVGPYGFFHLMNCDIVRNQANLFPAVFTLNPNPDLTNSRHGGVNTSNWLRPSSVYYNQIINTVLWGNDINSTMSAANANNALFQFNARLICNYVDGGYAQETKKYTSPLFDGNDDPKMPANQQELDGGSTEEQSDFGEVAWFSAYEAGRGVTPLNDADLRAAQYTPFTYARDMVYNGSHTYQNCNVLLSSVNFDLEGPNFINPSADPGCDGYDESSDWSPARLTNLTDNGSGQIMQTVALQDEKYSAQFNTYADFASLPSRSVYWNGGNLSGYTSETIGDLQTEGVYTTTRVLYGYDTHRLYMPAGEEEYMISASTGQKLYRISYDPNPTHDQTYIDIGVYEYPHTELQYTTDGDEVDILWVSASEKPDNGLPDGSAWSQPTSDFQRAIETLLSSRNGHRKEIRLMDGTFTPIYNIEDHLAFYIDTKTLNKSVTMTVKNRDDDGNVTAWNTGLGVKSLTIKGGYSDQIENVYDPEHYPAVIRQQARSNESSDRWDHLFYIADATQRYGLEESVGYTENNGYGSYKPTTQGTTTYYDQTVNTIPIHIDGVTIVNNQSRPGENGAAIYYADRTETDEVVPTDANISVNTYYTTDSENRTDADKSANNDPTLYYERTVDKYYTDAEYKTESAVPTAFATYKYVKNGNNKIIISKSKIMNSGSYISDDYTTSAVYIGKNGGNALLYNDVMHSNQGNPLVSAVPTTIVNNTYALNNGRVDLNGENTQTSSLVINQNGSGSDDDAPMLVPTRPRHAPTKATQSQIFNTVFWRNNDNGNQFILPGFVSVQQSGDIFAYNAFTGGNIAVSDYSLGIIPANNYNVGLSDENGDVINGPNFTDPKVGATTTAEIEARDFTLQPSLRLLNKGLNSLYNDKVVDADYEETSDYNIYDLSWRTTTRMDAAGDNRFVYDIDLGAYEYQNDLNRIIYVNPNVSASGLGNSWASPVAYGNLQAAVDLAAVYHVNNVGEEAYVFVKGAGAGSTGLHLGETITLRDGVSIYGSLLPTRTEDCVYTASTVEGKDTRTYKQEDIDAYIATVTAERGGVASPGGNKTTISGIKTSTATTFRSNNDIVSLIDGFDVTATTSTNTTGSVTEPVINVQPINSDGHVALRNIIVHDNDLSSTEDKDIAIVNNALIYEALFRDNSVGDNGHSLHIGANGYGVNLTVEGKTRGADGTMVYNGTDDNTKDHLHNSLVNYGGKVATENTLSGYNYKVSDKNLNYQLTEQSQHIDQCDVANPLEGIATLRQFINYDTDRDLLGNLRLLKGVSSDDKIDRGAFETWRVDNDVECTSATTTTSTAEDGAITTTTTPTNFYPHQGSVVYIMQGKNLVMEKYAAVTTTAGITQTTGTSFIPSYLLLQDGASLYGNGNVVNVGYVGVERTVKKDGQMVSLPYAMQYDGADAATNGVGTPSYSSEGVLSLSSVASDTYSYNGVGRSAWNSPYYNTASQYWTAVADDSAVDANSGVLFDIAQEKSCRFTAQGSADDMTAYVYTEAADAKFKTVTLTQHDDRTSTSGDADFTEKEDMGWNCLGLPYLVSNYNTTEVADAELRGASSAEVYNMNIPHTLWLYYDGTTSPDGTAVDGDGGFYSVSSWDDSDWHLAPGDKARIWVGEGFFTQTSAVADSEELKFYRPVYATTSPTPSPALNGVDNTQPVRRNARYYAGPKDINDAQVDITIRVRGHMIHVYGLEGGESITLYDTSGRIYNMATATGDTYSTAVPANGLYIVRVNEKSLKAVVK